MTECSTPCDDDCEALCHESHEVPQKRMHDVLECEEKQINDNTDGHGGPF